MVNKTKPKRGPKLTPDEAAELSARVEQAMRDGAYCRAEEILIARDFKVSTRTVRSTRIRIEASWRRAGGRRDLLAERVDWLERNRAAQRDLRKLGKDPHGLMLTEARVLGLMQPERFVVEAARPSVNPETPDGRAALLSDLRSLPRDLLLEALTATPSDGPRLLTLDVAADEGCG